MTEYAALSKTPHALADSLVLVFQHPVKVPMNSSLPQSFCNFSLVLVTIGSTNNSIDSKFLYAIVTHYSQTIEEV
jgi:hypothetical protein